MKGTEMTATATATATATSLRTGMIVIYHGTHEDFHGMLFRITATRTENGIKRFDLAYYHRGEHRHPVLHGAHAESITRIPASEIKDRKCSECGITYITVPARSINTTGCPMCALVDAVF